MSGFLDTRLFVFINNKNAIVINDGIFFKVIWSKIVCLTIKIRY